MRWPRTNRQAKEATVLGLLAKEGNLFGLDMIRASRGALKRHSIYVLLSSMEESGLIEGREVPQLATGRLPRRLYAITQAGRGRLEEMLAQMRQDTAEEPEPC
jgi:DNA-binding PadR family transcriptional regulator